MTLDASQRQQLAGYWRNRALPAGRQTGQALTCVIFPVTVTLHHFFALCTECSDWGSPGWVSRRAVWTCETPKILSRSGGQEACVPGAITGIKSVHVFRKPHSQIQGIIISFPDTVGVPVSGSRKWVGRLWWQPTRHVTFPEHNNRRLHPTPGEQPGATPKWSISLV